MDAPNKGIVVTYHYARDGHSEIPGGITPILVDVLERQHDWLQSNFEIVSGPEFLKSYDHAFEDGKKSPCLITFDDGTRDHLETVLPILERRCLSLIHI